MAKIAVIISVCCKLHNFVIDNVESLYIALTSEAEVCPHAEPADINIYLQDDFALNESVHRRRLNLES